MQPLEIVSIIGTLIGTVMAVYSSRKQESPVYAEQRATGSTSNDYSLAITAESKRVDMLSQKVDEMGASFKKALTEQSEEILGAISRATMETNQRFTTQSDLIVGLRDDVDKLFRSQNGNGSHHE